MVAPCLGELLIRVSIPFALLQDRRSFGLHLLVRRDLDKPNAPRRQGESYQRAEAVVGALHQVASSRIAEVVQEIFHAREHIAYSREDDGHSL